MRVHCMNMSYINMCKLNKNRENEEKNERKKLLVVVCVVVFLVNHLDKKPFRPFYIHLLSMCCMDSSLKV